MSAGSFSFRFNRSVCGGLQVAVGAQQLGKLVVTLGAVLKAQNFLLLRFVEQLEEEELAQVFDGSEREGLSGSGGSDGAGGGGLVRHGQVFQVEEIRRQAIPPLSPEASPTSPKTSAGSPRKTARQNEL